MREQKLLLTSQEVAKCLGVHPRTLLRAAQRGDLPKPVRIGRLIRWSARAIDEWLQNVESRDDVRR